MRQKSEQLELVLNGRGETPKSQHSGETLTTSSGTDHSGGDHRLMEQVVARANALAALKRVKQNKGSPGIDGMTVDDLTPHLAAHYPLPPIPIGLETAARRLDAPPPEELSRSRARMSAAPTRASAPRPRC